MGEHGWIAWLVGILVVARLLPLLVALPTALRLRLRQPSWEPVTPSGDEVAKAEWLQAVAAPLAPLGFEAAGFVRERPFLAGAESTLQLLLRHPDTGTWATVSAAPAPDARLPWRIDLETPLADGRSLLTLLALGHTLLSDPPGVVVHDVRCLTPEQLWQAHRERLAELGDARRLSFAEYLAHQSRLGRETLDALQRRGIVCDASDGAGARVRLAPAIAFARRVVAGSRTRETLLALRGAEIRKGRLPATPIPAWLELDAYRQARAARGHALERGPSLAILFGSAAAFALAMSWLLGPVRGLCLLAVVALHEAGHWAAMRAFGYRDTSVFFVPFLGAATAGRKLDAPLWQEMAVLLAGPLPGIALGAGLALLAPRWFAAGGGRELVVLLLALNAFNLLPILPLDGGKIVDRLLFGRRPRAAVAFALLGIAALAALAFRAGDPVLGAFAALFALGLRGHYRVARLRDRVRRAAPRDESERLRAAFAALPRDEKHSFAQRIGLVQALEASWVEAPARRTARAAWLGAYGLCLVVAGVTTTRALTAPRPLPVPPWLDEAGLEAVACDGPDPGAPFAALSPGESLEHYALVACLAEPVPLEELAAALDGYDAAQDLDLCVRAPWRMHELDAGARRRVQAARAAAAAFAIGADLVPPDPDLEALFERVGDVDPGEADVAALEQRLGACETPEQRAARVEALHGIALGDDAVRFAFTSDALHESLSRVRADLCARGCRVELRVGRFGD